ncbi:ZP domain-containing protein-like [Nematostella vectensis]|uniref:ZP domain-containing protein-like n=1 Tax=Nematostella vectensis TaxID=45351 RepID=UPI002077031B|nr:ZP domain-containing protein-like [Nematostella vectensis]
MIEVSTLYREQSHRNSSQVTRVRNFRFPFSCTYGRNQIVSTSYSHVGRYMASEGGYGNFTFKMSLYRNNSYKGSYESREYPIDIGVDEPLFLEYGVSSSTDLIVFAETCRATTTGSPNSWPQYDFIKDGCAVDNTMTYNYTLNRVQRFTIRSFRFVANHPVIYLHCFLMVCHSNVTNSRCAQGCVQPMRVRRETDTGMRQRGRRDVSDGSLLYELTPGPMKRRTTEKKREQKTSGQGGGNLSPVLVGVGATFGGLFLVVCFILIFVLRRNKNKPEVAVQMNHVTSYEQSGVTDDEGQKPK